MITNCTRSILTAGERCGEDLTDAVHTWHRDAVVGTIVPVGRIDGPEDGR